MYPDLIGRKAPEGKATYWMRCACGVLVGTGEALSGQETTCVHCSRYRDAPHLAQQLGGTPRAVTVQPQTQRNLTVALVLLCIVGAGLLTDRVSDAPSRSQAAGAMVAD